LGLYQLEKKGFLTRYPYLTAPIACCISGDINQLMMVNEDPNLGSVLTFATPLCSAIFDQRASIPVESVEEPLRRQVEREHPDVELLYFNKGL